MGQVIPNVFLLLFVAATIAFLLYRRKSISVSVPLTRALAPLVILFMIGATRLVFPLPRDGGEIYHQVLMLLLAASLLWLALTFRVHPRDEGETRP